MRIKYNMCKYSKQKTRPVWELKFWSKTIGTYPSSFACKTDIQ